MQHVFLCQPSPGCPFAPQLPAGKGRRYLIAHPVVPSARATPRRPRSSMANQVAIAATKSPYRTAALHSFGARNVSPPTITTTCQSERIPALFHHSNIGSSKSTFKRAGGNVGRAGDEARRRGLLQLNDHLVKCEKTRGWRTVLVGSLKVMVVTRNSLE